MFILQLLTLIAALVSNTLMRFRKRWRRCLTTWNDIDGVSDASRSSRFCPFAARSRVPEPATQTAVKYLHYRDTVWE